MGCEGPSFRVRLCSAEGSAASETYLVLAALCALRGRIHSSDATVVQAAPQGLTHPLYALDVRTMGGLLAVAEAALVVGVVHGARRQFRETVLDLRRFILQARSPVAAGRTRGNTQATGY